MDIFNYIYLYPHNSKYLFQKFHNFFSQKRTDFTQFFLFSKLS